MLLLRGTYAETDGVPSCWSTRLYRLAVLVSLPYHTTVTLLLNLLNFSVIEMQAILAETLENFEFALPKEKLEIIRAPAGPLMVPIIRGKEDLGTVMPLRVFLVQK